MARWSRPINMTDDQCSHPSITPSPPRFINIPLARSDLAQSKLYQMSDSLFGAGPSVSEGLKMTEANTANTRGVGLARLRGCLKVSKYLVCFSVHGGVAGPA